MIRTVFAFTILLFTLVQQLNSQIMYPGKPLYNPKTDTNFIPTLDIEIPTDYERPTSRNSNGVNLKTDDFAVPIEVDISPDSFGVWVDKPKYRKKIWLLKIRVKQATSINLFLSPFTLNEGAKVFIYNPSQTEVLGALTYQNNKEWDLLATTPIDGESIICELQVPYFLEDYGAFGISSVNAGYPISKRMKSARDKWYGTSQGCNLDVNCLETTNWNIQKNAVVRIVYKGGSRCTGTLINNTKNDKRPLVLTAGHCISTKYLAHKAVYSFSYEKSICNDTAVSNFSISGSNLLSTGGDNIDFSLVELSEDVPERFKPFYAGWDITNTLDDSLTIIHHPQGDIKKISISRDTISSYNVNGFIPYSHWLVPTYKIGTTEDGSSGAALLNKDGFVIGTLSGGNPTPCDTFMYDFYQKLSYSYNYYSDSAEGQLKTWLDPENTGTRTCDALDGFGAYLNIANKLVNYDTSSLMQNINQGDNWGYLAGHNYQGNELFAEKYSLNGSRYLYAAYVKPTALFTDNIEDYVTFYIWNGDKEPQQEIYKKVVKLYDLDTFLNYYITFDSTILVNNNFFFGYQINYLSDTFALATRNTTAENNTAFTFYDGQWQPLVLDGESEPSHLAIELLTFDFLPDKTRKIIQNIADITVYPNPAKGFVQVYFNENLPETVELILYDISGRRLITKEYIKPEANIRLELNTSPGMYILQIFGNSKLISGQKLLVY